MFKAVFNTLLVLMTVLFTLDGVEDHSSILIVNMKDELALPRNFRTVEDDFKNVEHHKPSEEGFRTLRMSGSGQFSVKSLRAMLSHLGNPHNFYIVDLRQESHGFLNGTAVSWYTKRNHGNIGKSTEQIQIEERLLLDDALNQREVVLSKVAEKDENGLHLPLVVSAPFTVHEMSTESDVASRFNINYIRIPVTDACRPTDEMVDAFIDFVKSLPNGSWIHFHCSAGVGRTSSFMILYDMIKNAKKVSFEDIIKRQHLIGGKRLDDFGPEDNWKHPHYVERYQFYKKFYHFCKTSHHLTGWSEAK